MDMERNYQQLLLYALLVDCCLVSGGGGRGGLARAHRLVSFARINSFLAGEAAGARSGALLPA